MYKQLIITRRDLNMTPGKLAAQVSHASMAPIIKILRESIAESFSSDYYELEGTIGRELMDQWVCGSFTKIICGAHNKNQLLAAASKATELGMLEGRDFFLIKDECRTVLTPEEPDGTTLTCIGFMPMEAEVIDPVGKMFHLY